MSNTDKLESLCAQLVASQKKVAQIQVMLTNAVAQSRAFAEQVKQNIAQANNLAEATPLVPTRISMPNPEDATSWKEGTLVVVSDANNGGEGFLRWLVSYTPGLPEPFLVRASKGMLGTWMHARLATPEECARALPQESLCPPQIKTLFPSEIASTVTGMLR